ncbi:unnamed protein product [Sphenostylis stenocarpa]|uniref:Uncharacterized protein n=1 Tax=Sphenostylis stenocarpa TaxID=92480 RepID=A0AA86VHZ0_9FABA|nr:unnamed protein product [Sphenostylis stenocarpa]
MKRYVVRLTRMERLMAKFGEKEMKFYLARFVERIKLLGKISFEVKWESVMEVGLKVNVMGPASSETFPFSIGSITTALLMEEEPEASQLNFGLPRTVTVGAFLVRGSFDSGRRTRVMPFARERVISCVHKGVGLSRQR